MLLPSEIQWIKNFVKRKVSEPCFQQGTKCEKYHPSSHSLQSRGQRTGVRDVILEVQNYSSHAFGGISCEYSPCEDPESPVWYDP